MDCVFSVFGILCISFVCNITMLSCSFVAFLAACVSTKGVSVSAFLKIKNKFKKKKDLRESILKEQTWGQILQMKKSQDVVCNYN